MNEQSSNKLETALRAIVERIPGEQGWWKSGNRPVFENLARILYEHYQDLTKVEEILIEIYSAVASEFGG